MANHVRGVLCALTCISTVIAQSLPYNPTSILLPPTFSQQKDIAYVFLQGTDSNHQLSTLNISSVIYASNFSLETVKADLPYDDSNAFVSSISASGDISVYTGSCSNASNSALWRFTPSNTSTNGSGEWIQDKTNPAEGTTSASLPGVNFLAPAFSFSTLVQSNVSDTILYTFGGMCPSTNATAETWQSEASYSNSMLQLAPVSSTLSQTTYTLGLASSRSPPIAEAGFSITGLTPTTSNNSGIATQQQNFVLLGGHTANAFINMSQVAIWSLPEESWSFVTVDLPSPSSNPNTELTVKSTGTSVDSRSGHTAVLADDGSKIIVYGGWVGDIGQAADPQLAVLELGTGFGGSGDWIWSVPDNQPSGSGIYGHGAAMLPGNVMMILGGYNISGSGSSKRDTSGAQAMFFNVTSLSWTSNYTNPSYVAAVEAQAAKASGSSSTAKKIGLGVGLGLGLTALLVALVFFLCYSRHLKRKRQDAREKDLRELSHGAANYYHSPTREMGQRNGGFPWANGGWNNGSNSGYDGAYDESNSAVAGYENIHSGVYDLRDEGLIPVPPRQIPRKPLHSRSARGSYQPTPDHGRTNSLGTAGPIHPIYEADEDGDHILPVAETVGLAVGEFSTPPGTSDSKRYSDPFKDPNSNQPVFSTPTSAPIRRNRSVSTNGAESPAESREREIQEWVSDWAAADILLNQQARIHSNAGRVSPTRRAQIIAASTISSVSGEEGDGRTASNLSERTERSVAISGMSISRSGSSSQSQGRGSRSNSLRGFIGGINPFGTAQSTTGASTNLSPIFDEPHGSSSRDRHLHPSPPKSAGSGSGKSANSFNTAHTSFHALQAEAETLLPRPGHNEDFSSPEHSPINAVFETPGSPSKSKPLGRGIQGRGWLGSLRRVFSPDSGSGIGDRSPSTFLAPGAAFRDESPERNEAYEGTSSQPRRTVSAGATLWRRKQGKLDWEDSLQIPTPNSTGRANTMEDRSPSGLSPGFSMGKGSTYAEDEDEWDIERAVENRVVQVMFTVPKEKLRVVNHDFMSDDGSEGGGSLRSKTGSFKVRKRKSLSEVLAGGEEGGYGEEEAEKEKEFRRIMDMDASRIPVIEEGKGTIDGEAEVERVDEQPSLASEAKRLAKVVDKGKAKEIREGRSPSPRRKGNSKVLEMVDKMEGRSPDRSPER